ncbi:hypothetical protein ACOMHN_020802 [Nucella lapillus]
MQSQSARPDPLKLKHQNGHGGGQGENISSGLNGLKDEQGDDSMNGLLQSQSKNTATLTPESTIVLCGTIRKLSNDREDDHTVEHFDNRHLSIRGETVSKVLKMQSVIKKSIRDHYFDRGYTEVQLTMSSQMHLETTLPALGDVYCIAPSYRAEPEMTRRHLTEYTHVEAECPFITFEDLLNKLEDVVCNVVDRVLRSPFAQLLYDLNPEFKAPSRPFRRMDYTEALVWLRDNDITKEDGTSYTFGDDKRLTQSVDLLMPGVGEVVGGSMRIWQLDEMLEGFKEEDIDPAGYYWYTDPLKYGSAPHGGYGIGLERFLVWLLNRHHIHEVCLYPRSVDRCVP